MQFSTDRIFTTHVGSLPRSQAVTDVVFAHEKGEDVSGADATIRDAFKNLYPLRRSLIPNEKSRRNLDMRKIGIEKSVMLMRENFCRRHDGNLNPIAYRHSSRKDGNNRFA